MKLKELQSKVRETQDLAQKIQRITETIAMFETLTLDISVDICGNYVMVPIGPAAILLKAEKQRLTALRQILMTELNLEDEDDL